ncbi:MAG: L-fucose/L-arabinose isomerase family protein [Planctomycetes bacterium]|nr:L-fucose/L-arabinose isomerase family protein [Planctomycetota bacterium]
MGLLPTHRAALDPAAARRQREKLESKLNQLGVNFVSLNWLNDDGLLSDPADAERIAARFDQEDVDAVFAAHCDFGAELAVGRTCKVIDKPVLLWGPRDEGPGPDGMRERDTQCGIFPAGKILRRMGLPFSYIVNCRTDDEVFERGLDNFLRAVNVARCLKGARIGQVSTRPGSFTSVICNEGELLERFGIEVVPVALSSLTGKAKARLDSEETRRELEEIHQKVEVKVEEDQMLKVAALKLAIRDWAMDERLDGIALQCWSALQDELGISSCFVHAEMTDLGVPMACETDIHGAISAVAAQAAGSGDSAPFFADLTVRHPENDNAELLWHCGPFPLSLAKGDAEIWPHFGMELGAVGHWEIRGGDITLIRFDGDRGRYRMFTGHARGTDGPATHGTYLWVEVNDWPRWEERFVCGPYVHHIVGVHGKLAPVFYEACKFIGDIEPDLIDPEEDDIRAYLRGGPEL